MKVIKYLSTLTIILAFFLVFYFAYLLFWPQKIIVFHNPNSIQIDKQSYHPGDRVIYTLDYCKYQNISGLISRAIVDGFRQTYTDLESNLPTGCHVIKVSDLIVPTFFPPGNYYITISGVYKINNFRTFQTPLLRTVDFEVK